MTSTNRKIARASIILILITILGNMLGLFKEILVAKYFGITRAIDSFYAALSIPTYLLNIILAPFVPIFIPLYIKYRSENTPQDADKLANIFINYILIVFLIMAACCVLFSRQIIGLSFSGFDPGTIATTATMLRIVGVTILFSGMITIFTGIINAHEKFFWPAASQMLVTLSNIFFLVAFSKKWGGYVFAWGLFFGLLAQCLILVYNAVKIGYRHHLDFNWKHPAIVRLFQLASLAMLSSVIAGFTPYFNRVVASWLPEGSIASLAYADKIFSLPTLIFSGTMVTALFPFISLQAAEKRIDELKHTLASSIKMSAFIFIPIAVIIIILAKPLVQLLFQRGAFDTFATDLTSNVLVFLSFQLFFIYSIGILQRVIFAFYGMKSVLVITVITTILNIVLNVIFVKVVNPPVVGIALASSIVCAVSALLHFFVVKRELTFLHGISIIKSILGFCALAFIAGGGMYLVYNQFGRIIDYSFAFRAVKIGVSASIGFVFYGLLAYLFKLEEFTKAFSLFKEKVADYLK